MSERLLHVGPWRVLCGWCNAPMSAGEFPRLGDAMAEARRLHAVPCRDCGKTAEEVERIESGRSSTA